MISLAVAYEESQQPEASLLAQELNLPLLPLGSTDAGFLLVLTQARLELREVGSKTGPVFVDFSVGRRGKDPLLRAVGVKGDICPKVVDATAGLGQDALALARAGCQVRLVERSPIIAALLADGLERARSMPETQEVTDRLTLINADTTPWLHTLEDTARPDVVYLDPMYPASGKSAAKNKEMRFFRDIVGADSDADTLLEAARAVSRRRVVVKRPLKAPFLGDQRPSSSLTGKTTRFDLYVVG